MVRHLSLMSRIAAAIVGGYALAVLFSVSMLSLPVGPSEAAFWGLQFSFLVYTVAVIWVFAVRSAWRAWAGLVLAAVLLLPAAAWVWYGGSA